MDRPQDVQPVLQDQREYVDTPEGHRVVIFFRVLNGIQLMLSISLLVCGILSAVLQGNFDVLDWIWGPLTLGAMLLLSSILGILLTCRGRCSEVTYRRHISCLMRTRHAFTMISFFVFVSSAVFTGVDLNSSDASRTVFIIYIVLAVLAMVINIVSFYFDCVCGRKFGLAFHISSEGGETTITPVSADSVDPSANINESDRAVIENIRLRNELLQLELDNARQQLENAQRGNVHINGTQNDGTTSPQRPPERTRNSPATSGEEIDSGGRPTESSHFQLPQNHDGLPTIADIRNYDISIDARPTETSSRHGYNNRRRNSRESSHNIHRNEPTANNLMDSADTRPKEPGQHRTRINRMCPETNLSGETTLRACKPTNREQTPRCGYLHTNNNTDNANPVSCTTGRTGGHANPPSMGTHDLLAQTQPRRDPAITHRPLYQEPQLTRYVRARRGGSLPSSEHSNELTFTDTCENSVRPEFDSSLPPFDYDNQLETLQTLDTDPKRRMSPVHSKQTFDTSWESVSALKISLDDLQIAMQSQEEQTIEISRSNIVEDCLCIYDEDKSIVDKRLRVNFLGEVGEDIGGLTKDMFTSFWNQTYKLYCKGDDALVPHVNINESSRDREIMAALGRALTHMVSLTGCIPAKLCKCSLLQIANPNVVPSDDLLLQDFLLYIPRSQRKVLDAALRNPSLLTEVHMRHMLDIFSHFEMRELPNVKRIKQQILCIARSEIIQKPMCFTTYMRYGLLSSSIAASFWSDMNESVVRALYKRHEISTSDVIRAIRTEENLKPEQEVVRHFLFEFIQEINLEQLQGFLYYVTGSLQVPDDGIQIIFSVGSSNPVAHTCGNVLEIPVSYVSYQDFYQSMCHIINSGESLSMGVP